jgi:hypothetical protein
MRIIFSLSRKEEAVTWNICYPFLSCSFTLPENLLLIIRELSIEGNRSGERVATIRRSRTSIRTTIRIEGNNQKKEGYYFGVKGVNTFS